MDLFSSQQDGVHQPLAARMRPRTLDEFIGQEHIVGKGRLLRRAIAADQLTSVIFYGPPGTGKTTLARVIANHTKSNFITLNAVLAGVQSIRDAIANADDQHKLYGKKTILFVDEVHRWNKSQQDALLPWVENGTLILVGATTENPFFEVNKALVSRSRVFQLKPLEKSDLLRAVQNALGDPVRGYGNWTVRFESGALEHLIETANGDARNLLNALELAVETTPEHWPPPTGAEIFIGKETAEESIQRKVVLYDRDGDYHYDIISAFIKSLRGRDPDAALYWMARMISAGEDPHFIFRRMIISACEDTGLADPNAIGVVESCAAAFDRIGLPEGRFMLTQAALYLATAPKSNSTLAFFDALKTVQEEDAEVPNHLRDSSRDSEGFAHGKGYLYPHAYRDHWVSQQYLPDALMGRVFYTPSDQGYESSIKQEVLSRRELQIASILEGITFEGESVRGDDEQREGERGERCENQSSIVRGADETRAQPNGANTYAAAGTSAEPESLKNRAPQNATAANGEPSNRAPNGESGHGGAPQIAAHSAHSGAAVHADSSARIPLDAAGNPIGDWWEAEHLKNGVIKTGENLTYTPKNKSLEQWQRRTDEGRAESLLQLRNTLLDGAKLVRHSRNLIMHADDGLFLWEALRRSPEGFTGGVCKTEKGRAVLTQYASTLSEIERPVLALSFDEFTDVVFDNVFFRDPFTTIDAVKTFAEAWQNLLHGTRGDSCSDESTNGAPNASGAAAFTAQTALFAAQRLPYGTQRLSPLCAPFFTQNPTEQSALTAFSQAEESFFTQKDHALFGWNEETVCSLLREHGFNAYCTVKTIAGKKRIGAQDAALWFDTQKSEYGAFIAAHLSKEDLAIITQRMAAFAANAPLVDWNSLYGFFVLSLA